MAAALAPSRPCYEQLGFACFDVRSYKTSAIKHQARLVASGGVRGQASNSVEKSEGSLA